MEGAETKLTLYTWEGLKDYKLLLTSKISVKYKRYNNINNKNNIVIIIIVIIMILPSSTIHF